MARRINIHSPGVGAQLFVVRLEGLHDAADAELEVALGAVQSANHQVHDAEVKHRLGGVCKSRPLFFL